MWGKLKALFKRKEPELTPRIKAFADRVDKWHKDNPEIFIGSPGTEAQEVVNCLQELFLGEDWYIGWSARNIQANTIILHEILVKHSEAYCKYRKRRNEQ